MKRDVVLRERRRRQRQQRDAVLLGILADRRMHGAGEAVEEARLDAAGREELAHVLERVDRVLHGLRGEAVHQVRVHQDARVGEGARHARDLLDGDAFLHQLEQAVGRHLEPARDRDAAAVGELPAELRREGLLEADVAPPGDRQLALLELARRAPSAPSAARPRRRSGSRSGRSRRRSPRCGRPASSAVASVVARDVVEGDVAEAALLPVAAVRDRELVPAAVGPEPVHRVQHVEQRQIVVERQAVPSRRADFVERDVGLASKST